MLCLWCLDLLITFRDDPSLHHSAEPAGGLELMDVDDVVFERRAVEPVVQRFSPDVNPVVTHHSADAYFAAVGLQDKLLSFLLETVQLQELFCDADAVARNLI